MIKKIHFARYRKLENLDLEFSSRVNVISGPNGTCKSSILHIVSNSFKQVPSNWEGISPGMDSRRVLHTLNSQLNTKIESLAKGDRTYNDPARGLRGTLYTVRYIDDVEINFRRHNTRTENRFAVKPPYRRNNPEKLPICPAVYLGLTRLYPYGEYVSGDERLLKDVVPPEYLEELKSRYEQICFMNIDSIQYQNMGSIKKRANFTSDREGIDSNTISVGEENVYIILSALISLKYFHQSLAAPREVDSVLLIDEFDASLHPSLQKKLYDLIREYAESYHIQVFINTHSLVTINYALEKKDNLIYLENSGEAISVLQNPDKYKIEAFLKGISVSELYKGRAIPIFTEDDEARWMLRHIFAHFEKTKPEFQGLSRYFNLLPTLVGCENLKTIFGIRKNDQNSAFSDQAHYSQPWICILDNDSDNQKNLTHSVLVLPGDGSPEKTIFEYMLKLSERPNATFNRQLTEKGYSNESFKTLISQLRTGNTSSQKDRKWNKDFLKKNLELFDLILDYWLEQPENKESIDVFYNDLRTLFKKHADANRISTTLWE